jgi:tRNA modification GTPase
MSRGASIRDTIVAIATPAGRGGIGVVRLSGPQARDIGARMVGTLPVPRYVRLTDFVDGHGDVIDTGLALFFPAPHSFTGEDVIEFQGHGGPVVLDMLQSALVSMGARLALPGEFSERAFLNDKIDLSQAEAIADLIDSVSTEAARGALKSLHGEFSKRVRSLTEKVVDFRVHVEAAMDFPEEEIDFLPDGALGGRLADIRTELENTLQQATEGALLREGITLVIAGRPNAGKSSLMNALSGSDVSIVTRIPGTTRDVVRQAIHLDGIPLHLVDTAGIRKTEDEVEIEGVRRALTESRNADQVLLVVDLEQEGEQWRQHVATLRLELAVTGPVTVVLNKRDLTPHLELPVDTPGLIVVSARTGQGIEALKAQIKLAAGVGLSPEGTFTARRRHLDALARAQSHITAGQSLIEAAGGGELIAEELRLCHRALAEITGEFSSDDLLGRIFSSFCIGK